MTLKFSRQSKGGAMFSELNVIDFRTLKNRTFLLGRYITMLSGWNATGKSTVLALLANSSELKLKDGKTYIGKRFRANFSEILKGSHHDKSRSSHRASLTWDYANFSLTKTFRTTWQSGDRFRLIPAGKDPDTGKETSAKFPVPVIYLGLSRLYPLGETTDDQLQDSQLTFKHAEDENWFFEKHNHILSLTDDIRGVMSIDFKSAKKNTFGVNTATYDWKTNSSGQDNLGQILLAILSFRNLKRENPAKFQGGLLLIDELEATFHPKAQEKIIELLIKEAKTIGFQVVFTTHSLAIAEMFSEKVRSNDGNMRYYYFTKGNNILEIWENPPFSDIENDLLLLPIAKRQLRKLTVYTEDSEARWLLRKLLKSKYAKISAPNITIGCQALIDLMNVEPAFKDYLVVFDGDLQNGSKGTERIRKNKNNFLKLPPDDGKTSPEKLLFDFINSRRSDRFFGEQHKKNKRIKKEYFDEHGLKGGGKAERDLYKAWFSKHVHVFESTKIIDYWIAENQSAYNAFLTAFKEKYNRLAVKLSLNEIA